MEKGEAHVAMASAEKRGQPRAASADVAELRRPSDTRGAAMALEAMEVKSQEIERKRERRGRRRVALGRR